MYEMYSSDRYFIHEFLFMTLNIHQAFEMSLEEQSVCSNEEALFFWFLFLNNEPELRFFSSISFIFKSDWGLDP